MPERDGDYLMLILTDIQKGVRSNQAELQAVHQEVSRISQEVAVLRAEQGSVDELKVRVDKVEAEVDAVRMRWAKLSGIALAAAAGGGGLAQVLAQMFGGG